MMGRERLSSKREHREKESKTHNGFKYSQRQRKGKNKRKKKKNELWDSNMNAFLANLLLSPGMEQACSGHTSPASCYDMGKRRRKTFPSRCPCGGTGTAAAPTPTTAGQGTGEAGTDVALGWEQQDGWQ